MKRMASPAEHSTRNRRRSAQAGVDPTPELALRLQRAGRYAEAEDAYAAYLAIHPADAQALANAGLVALKAGRMAIAVKRCEQLAALRPDDIEARVTLGHALTRAGRPVHAIFHLDRAVQLAPRNAAAHHHLGIAFERAGDRSNAIRAFERALTLDPGHADAAANLGVVLNRRGNTAAARAAFARALARDPGHLDARTGIAVADAIEGDLDRARKTLEAMARERPNNASFWDALGIVRAWSGALAEAGDAYRQAAAQDQGDTDARVGIATTLLAARRYAEGFRALEDRPGGRYGDARRFSSIPVWTGAALAGPLLVHCDGSLSDTIQFARFIPAARQRVRELVLVVDDYWAPLAPLFATLSGVDHLLDDGTRVNTLAARPVARAAIQSLAHHLNATAESLPVRMPYLAAPTDRAAAWQARLAALPRPRVGLVWSTRGDRGALARHKSVRPDELAPVIATPGVSFVSVQIGAMGTCAPFGDLAGRIMDLSGEIRDFGDTAAIIDALDLVIAVDTAVAHIAGAMGKPVWLLDRFHTSWRWRLSPGHSPWYPSLTIFRQHRFLDWSHAVAAIAAALAAFVADGTFPP
jgi:tetratricopeptide (TPR) repeat protein